MYIDDYDYSVKKKQIIYNAFLNNIFVTILNNNLYFLHNITLEIIFLKKLSQFQRLFFFQWFDIFVSTSFLSF